MIVFDCIIILQFVGGLILEGDVWGICPDNARLFGWTTIYSLGFKYVLPGAVYSVYKLFVIYIFIF